MSGGVNSTSHTQTDSLDSAPNPCITSHVGASIFSAGTHIVETNFTRSEFPSRIPAPGDTLPRKKDQSDGSNSAEGDQSQCSPWAPPVAMTPRKTLQSLSGPGLSGPLGSSWRSSAQAAHPLSPVPGLLTPGTLGIVCHVGFGLLGGADREQ